MYVTYLSREMISPCNRSKDALSSSNVVPLNNTKKKKRHWNLQRKTWSSRKRSRLKHNWEKRCVSTKILNCCVSRDYLKYSNSKYYGVYGKLKKWPLTCLWLFNRRKATMFVLITAQQFTASKNQKMRTLAVLVSTLNLGVRYKWRFISIGYI